MSGELTGDLLSRWIDFKLNPEPLGTSLFSPNVILACIPSAYHCTGADPVRQFLLGFFGRGSPKNEIEIISSKMDVRENALFETFTIAATANQPNLNWLIPEGSSPMDVQEKGSPWIWYQSMGLHFSDETLVKINVEWDPQQVELQVLPKGDKPPSQQKVSEGSGSNEALLLAKESLEEGVAGSSLAAFPGSNDGLGAGRSPTNKLRPLPEGPERGELKHFVATALESSAKMSFSSGQKKAVKKSNAPLLPKSTSLSQKSSAQFVPKPPSLSRNSSAQLSPKATTLSRQSSFTTSSSRSSNRDCGQIPSHPIKGTRQTSMSSPSHPLRSPDTFRRLDPQRLKSQIDFGQDSASGQGSSRTMTRSASVPDAVCHVTPSRKATAHHLATNFTIGDEQPSQPTSFKSSQPPAWSKDLRPYLNKGSTGIRL
ncbi:hypothetical protein L0F63_006357 [Massospora cicadina]|nr:hypothetical protein L0F63_006357 [Massospora cicadina]